MKSSKDLSKEFRKFGPMTVMVLVVTDARCVQERIRRRVLSDSEQSDSAAADPVTQSTRRSFVPRRTVVDQPCRRTLSQSRAMTTMWNVALLDAEQIQRVELFYSSHATQVDVCRCLASLYFTSPAPATGMSPTDITSEV